MKKENPRRWHLTDEEKKKIVQLYRRGLRKVEIARELGIRSNTVTLCLRKAGFVGRKPFVSERKARRIVELLRSGIGQRRVARRVRVSFSTVVSVARAAGLGARRIALSENECRRIIFDIIGKRANAASIAKARGVSYKRVLQMAHQWLACEKFLPIANPPLMPSKETSSEENALQLISKIFPNGIPEGSNEDIAVVIFGRMQRCAKLAPLLSQPDEVLTSFMTSLDRAITTLRESATRWKN